LETRMTVAEYIDTLRTRSDGFYSLSRDAEVHGNESERREFMTRAAVLEHIADELCEFGDWMDGVDTYGGVPVTQCYTGAGWPGEPDVVRFYRFRTAKQAGW
jgi:hypothetical protein